MSDNLPLWCLDKPQYGWSSPDGLRELRRRVHTLVPFELDTDQYGLSAQAMDRNDLFVIRATGSGKTMVIIVPLLARPRTIALVISPLNMLEQNMVRTFESFGIPAVAINGDTLRAAVREGRNLWDEAEQRSRAIFMAPERVPSDEFEHLIKSPRFREYIALVPFDEAQVVDEWGDEFRTAYGSLAHLRPRLPPWVTYIGLTATCRPGPQMDSILRGLGLRDGHFILHHGDCERHDLSIMVRPILHGVSGYSFADLDWLVPLSVSTADDLLSHKTLLYCNTIEVGHRVMNYLRSLLPDELRPQQNTLIRHTTSISCPLCKQDCLNSLLDVPGASRCAIQVATDIVGFGVDARHVERVVCFDVPNELNTVWQRIGRTGRRGDTCDHPIAYIYLKESMSRTAVTTELIEDRLPPHDLTSLRALHSTIYEPGEPEEIPDGPSADQLRALQSHIASLSRATATRKTCLDALDRFRAVLAIVQASQLGYCITLRANQLYANPGTTNCGRCSSCIDDHIPLTRLGELLLRQPSTESAETVGKRVQSTMPKDFVVRALADIRAWLRRKWLAVCEPASFLDSTTIIDQRAVERVAKQLLKITTMSQLQTIVGDWSYWSLWGEDMWALVSHMRERYTVEVRAERSAKAKAAREKRKRGNNDSLDDSNKENIPPPPKRQRKTAVLGKASQHVLRSSTKSKAKPRKKAARRK